MNRADNPYACWTRRHLVAAIVTLFILQVGLILLFGDHSKPPALPPVSPIRFGALSGPVSEDQLLSQYLVGNPAVFPLPGKHGFSGSGWMNQGPSKYQPEDQLEPAQWLALDPSGLGTNFPQFLASAGQGVSGWAAQLARPEDPWPALLPPEVVTTESVLVLSGGLENRPLWSVPKLRAQPNAELLRTSRVQIAVDPAGEVVAARLDKSCGLDLANPRVDAVAKADAEAVAKARALRFQPVSSSATQWGEAVFQWETVEPPAAPPPK